MDRRLRHVVVVGGGIAGLSAAFFLTRDAPPGVRVTLLESSDSLGGKLRLGAVAGVPVDVGAEALLLRRAEGTRLVNEVGLAADLVAPRTTSAAIWSRRRLRPIPSGTVMGVPSDLRALAATGLLSPRELARLPLDAWLPRTQIGDDTSVGRYVAARLGAAVVERLVEPLLGGVYAGRADLLSLDATLPRLAEHARTQKSAVAAARASRPRTATRGPVFGSLRGGLARLPAAVATAAAERGARVHLGATVRELRRTPEGWALTTGSTRSPEVVAADAVLLALPAAPAAKLLTHPVPHAASELRQIPYASVGIVTLAFRATDVAEHLSRGSGFLVPPVDRRVIKAATFTTTKWPWYADVAPDVVIVRASVGRFQEEADLQRADEDLVEAARADLADATGVLATPIDADVTRWGGALPQYNVGHRARVERIGAAVAGVPGLALCGAAYDGIGIPACVASAERGSAELLEQWAHA